MIKNSKKKSKNIRNATPASYSLLTQSSTNLEEDDVVFGENDNIKRPIDSRMGLS
jgi:nitrogenase molybdenum-iron protein alpha/beta subunit